MNKNIYLQNFKTNTLETIGSFWGERGKIFYNIILKLIK